MCNVLCIYTYVHRHLDMADSSGSALQAVEATIQKTASVLSGRSTAAMPSKGFQLLVRAIGEAKTKHVGTCTLITCGRGQ